MSQQSVYLKVHGETPFKILILSMHRDPDTQKTHHMAPDGITKTE